MTTPRKPRDVVSDLLSWSEADEQHSDDAAVDDELAAAGVDVPTFLEKVRARIADVESKERLAWRADARKKIAAHRARASQKYDSYDRSMLMTELAKRQASGEARAFFHKFEDLPDEDLRTLLEDHDSLDENGDGESK